MFLLTPQPGSQAGWMQSHIFKKGKKEARKVQCVFACAWNSRHIGAPCSHVALAALPKDGHSTLLLFFPFIRKWPILFKSYSLVSDWKTDRWQGCTDLTLLSGNRAQIQWAGDSWRSFSDRWEHQPLQVGWAVLWNVPFRYFPKAFWVYRVDCHCGTQDFPYETPTSLSLSPQTVFCVICERGVLCIGDKS